MKKRNLIPFLLSFAFGLSMVLYSAGHISASAGHRAAAFHSAGNTSCPAKPEYDRINSLKNCPAQRNAQCPVINTRPGQDAALSAGRCPAYKKGYRSSDNQKMIKNRPRHISPGSGCPNRVLEKKQRSAYIFILEPAPGDMKQGTSVDEIRI